MQERKERPRVFSVLLAAGGSSRMGSPKQLLTLEGESLVRRAARAALGSACDGVVAVLGAHAEAVAGELAGLDLTQVRNSDWGEGIGASIRCGLEEVLAREPTCEAVLLVLADQPGVTSALLDRLVAEWRAGECGLVACAYAGSLGAPALFARAHFEALRGLGGDRGAKALLLERESEVRRVEFPDGAIDIDTPQDYEELRRSP